MSFINSGLRRIAVVGLSALVATTAMTGGAATTYAATNTSTIKALAALPGETGFDLGPRQFAETTAGEYFPTGDTTVVLTLSAGTFTAGVTPTITVPTGYSNTNPVTASGSTYTFTVTAPATPVVATVTFSGLTMTAPATVQTLNLDALVGTRKVDGLQVVNVVNYAARTGGANRYETAADLFDSEFTGAPDAILSSGASFPDALSANYLAGAYGTGTLLTPPSTLSTYARRSLVSSHVDTVYITGETGAVSRAVENQVKAIHVGDVSTAPFITVVRLGGANRYLTNQIINESVFQAVPTVLMASGQDFPDALALGPVAYQGFPMILTRGTTMGAPELAQLAEFKPVNVVIAGGTTVVSDVIEAALKAKGYHVLRLEGSNRTLTAAAIATWATVGIAGATAGSVEAAQGAVSDTTYIATGNSFADALAAGPVAGINGRMIILSPFVAEGIPSYLNTKTVGTTANSATEVGTLHALGGTAAVSVGLMSMSAMTLGPSAP